jgi:cold shock CspA family protein
MTNTVESDSIRTETGVVRKLRDGYGFIAGNDGVDYYFHWTAMRKDTKNFRELAVGDRASFQCRQNEKGPRALEVLILV